MYSTPDLRNINRSEIHHKHDVSDLCSEEAKTFSYLSVNCTAGTHNNIGKLCSDIALGKSAAVSFKTISDPRENAFKEFSYSFEQTYNRSGNTGEKGFDLIRYFLTCGQLGVIQKIHSYTTPLYKICPLTSFAMSSLIKHKPPIAKNSQSNLNLKYYYTTSGIDLSLDTLKTALDLCIVNCTLSCNDLTAETADIC